MWLHWLACEPEPSIVDSATDDPVPTFDPFAVVLEAPVWRDDPLLVFADVTPTVNDAAGAEVALAEVPWQGFGGGWRPAEGWDPGTYTVTALDGVELGWSFTVGDHGEAPVDGSIVGRAWTPVDGVAASGLVPLVQSQGTPTVVVEAVDGDDATFSVVLTTSDVTCVVYRDHATFDGARLTWSWPSPVFRVAGPDGPLDVEARDWFAEIAFTADASRGAGTAHGEIDTRNLDLLWGADAGDSCSLVQAFGAACVPCPDGAEQCFRDELVQIEWEEAPAPDLAALPLCGFDRVEVDVPDLGCDTSFDCGCTGSPGGSRFGFALAALAAWTARRRGQPSPAV